MGRRIGGRTGAAAGLAAIWCGGGATALAQVDMLPDIVTRESDLHDHDIVLVGNQRRLRLSNGTANAGAGKLYLRGGQDLGNGTQEVLQRIFRDDNSWWERVAGEFIFHPQHNHVHFEDWSEYRLREYLPGGGVGPIISVGRKVSFCIVDFSIYDSSLPGFSFTREFVSCTGVVQGLSIGWVDVYTKSLPDQYVDITGVQPGVYWLESVADPFDSILEEDETNNIARIPVPIDLQGAEDVYEPNDSVTGVQARPVGMVNSPNIGPCDPQFIIPSLTIDELVDEDFFRFYMPGEGTIDDFVRIDFVHSLGDLELRLLDDAGTELLASQTANDSEIISLKQVGPGWFVAHVRGAGGGAIAEYEITIDPSENTPPSINVTDPPPGDVQIVHGQDTYEVHWNSSDPESDPTWVTFFLNGTPVLDGNELKDFANANTPGAVGMATINSSAYPPGTYYIYCEITDGGSRSGDWSDGTLSLVPPVGCLGDLDNDGDTDVVDFAFFVGEFAMTVVPGTGADLDGSGMVDVLDFGMFADDFGCVQ